MMVVQRITSTGPSELSDAHKPSHGEMQINEIGRIEPRSQAHVMRGGGGLIHYQAKKIVKNVLFGKTAVTFAYDLGLRRFLYEN